MWSLKNRRLRLYNEIYMTMVTANSLAREIIDKMIVPLESKTGWVSCHKIIGNKDFNEVGKESIGKELKKYKIRVRPNTTYDENAAIVKINQMFANRQIVIHTDCVETDVQWRGWSYQDQKPKEGYPLARVLCLVVSELRSSGKLQQQFQAPAYSKYKQGIREKLRTEGDRKQIHIHGNSNKQHEYLTR